MYTIGHSTRTIDEFIAMLKKYDVKLLVDVRTYPFSRRYPHFNHEPLEKSLNENGIKYLHIKKLGGRRKVSKDSRNTRWRNDSFRGYADYMETEDFKEGINELLAAGPEQDTAIMCSEAVWWRCHRSMISDYLKSIGIRVIHIIDLNHTEEHPYTAPARIVHGKLTYHEPELF